MAQFERHRRADQRLDTAFLVAAGLAIAALSSLILISAHDSREYWEAAGAEAAAVPAPTG